MVRPPYGRRPAAAVIAVAASLVGLSADAQQILLLDFWSPSCGPCMQMKPLVHSFEQAGYPIRPVDTTQDGQLSAQYNVTRIPCFVMLVNGRETERQIGPMSSQNLQQLFERAKDEVRRENGVRNQSPVQLPTTESSAPSQSVAVGPTQQPMEQPWPSGTATPNERPATDMRSSASNAAASAHPALLAATVRLSVDDEKGRDYGTGTIIDTRSGEALVVTCGHLFRESKGKAPVKADLYEVAGDSVRVVGHATGQVISYDLNRDVALVSIKPDRPVTMTKVAPPKTALEKGDRVVGIGCSNGNDPTVMETRITSLDRYQGHPNIEVSGAPAIGRSGGGLFNSRDELIGICNNADPEGNEGIYAGLESIHGELDRLGLKDIYSKPGAAGAAAQTVAGQSLGNEPSVIRGQEPRAITPIPNDASTYPGTAAAAKSAAARNLSPTEQAALEEIMSRATTSEVVCIVRPKDAGGQSEVIQLDSVSPEFIRALKEHAAPASKTR
jgi:thiol-disulfide isomerase/thioredoxin